MHADHLEAVKALEPDGGGAEEQCLPISGSMQHPYQCAAVIEPATEQQESTKYLLVAGGDKLSTICLATGRVVHEWTAAASGWSSTSRKAEKSNEADERPAKRQKTAPKSIVPNIVKLAIAPTNSHAVVVTDDKCVRVFEVQHDGNLLELSQRVMPKRPCAVQILPDSTTILCGDKFGDVYSLPLLIEPSSTGKYGLHPAADNARATSSFKPSATNSTVHTQRNRKALEAQLKQKDLVSKTKESLNFEHKLLLGHVSMLTDMVYAQRVVDDQRRDCIITADRDEHIRVTRGPPQSHIIEGYCLGHKEFVSKLCLIPGTDLLVSGGGDDFLAVWDWPSFELKQKCPLDMVYTAKASPTATQPKSIAISGIWVLPADAEDGTMTEVVVAACENFPGIWVCPISKLREGKASFNRLALYLPVLDIAVAGRSIIMSMDGRQEGVERQQPYRVRVVGLGEVRLQPEKDLASKLEKANAIAHDLKDDKDLDGFLYTVENMRKKDGDRLDNDEDT